MEQVVEAIEVEVVEPDAALALFGPAVRAERRQLQAAALDWLDLRREWQSCFQAWLEETALSPKTLDAYTRAWNDLLVFVGLPSKAAGITPVTEFWFITHKHIRAWADDLATRDLDQRRQKTLERRGTPRTRGYSQATIGQYLAAVSRMVIILVST